MQKWEYTIHPGPGDSIPAIRAWDEAGGLAGHLARSGQEGWELVQILPNQHMILKRHLAD